MALTFARRCLGAGVQIGMTLILVHVIVEDSPLSGVGFAVVVYSIATALLWAGLRENQRAWKQKREDDERYRAAGGPT